MREIKDNPIICQKYNYTLDSHLMNYFQFESSVTLSEEGDQLLIRNKKHNTTPDYVFEKTPSQVQEQKAKSGSDQQSIEKAAASEEDFEYTKSNSSCKVDDI